VIAMVRIKTVDLTKRFGEVVAVDRVSLEIEHGEFFTLLGPSGCGKTTFLRCIAGLELPDEGRVYFDGEDVTDVPPHRRDTGMVFQNYALWPHMNVFDNIAYGLKIRGLPKNEIRKRVEWALELVKLKGLEKRTPHQLSGGQQQRVALARAIVINPKVLLFDEPLSNLDAKLRLEMRAELRRLQKELGITTIYVTHDQEEAMSISDRLAIMKDGRIMQVGTPREVYDRPANFFVADFIGQSTFIEGTVVGEVSSPVYEVDTSVGRMRAVPSLPDASFSPGERVILAIRPENFSLECLGGDNSMKVVVHHVAFLGKHLRVHGESDGVKVIAELPKDVSVSVGDVITLCASPREVLMIKG